MKNTATVLLAVFFLLAGCSKEATYFFLKPSGSFTKLHKPQKAENLNHPNTAIAHTAVPAPEPASLLAAATPPTPVLPVPHTPVTDLLRTNTGAPTEVLPRAVSELHNVLEPAQQKPAGKKKAMIGKAETGFALSLFGVVSIALLLISPYFLYFSGLLTVLGIIFSFLGLLKVRASNGKFRGKVRALIGLTLGILGTALVVLLLNDKF